LSVIVVRFLNKIELRGLLQKYVDIYGSGQASKSTGNYQPDGNVFLDFALIDVDGADYDHRDRKDNVKGHSN